MRARNAAPAPAALTPAMALSARRLQQPVQDVSSPDSSSPSPAAAMPSGHSAAEGPVLPASNSPGDCLDERR